jgi:uncharacterized protein
MREIKSLKLFFILFVFICNYSFSQDKPNVIEVTGSATIEVIPDLLDWSINITEETNDIQSAKKTVESSTAEILEYLKSIGIKEEKVTTSGLRITKNYQYDAKTKKYTVKNDIWFESAADAYQKIADYIILIEDVYISFTNLKSSKEIEIRKQARVNALVAAKEKAEAMAAVFGKTIGDPLLISEETLNYYQNTMNNVSNTYYSGESDSGPAFSKGEISVNAKVKVIFLLK